jgi:hypothetical protein
MTTEPTLSPFSHLKPEEVIMKTPHGLIGWSLAVITVLSLPALTPGESAAQTPRSSEAVGRLPPNPDPPCFDNANRYVDCGNGTVTDTATGMIWLKDAGCLGALNWADANHAAARLKQGQCGLTDRSRRGDWRLPTNTEWQTMVAVAKIIRCCSAPIRR